MKNIKKNSPKVAKKSKKYLTPPINREYTSNVYICSYKDNAYVNVNVCKRKGV